MNRKDGRRRGANAVGRTVLGGRGVRVVWFGEAGEVRAGGTVAGQEMAGVRRAGGAAAQLLGTHMLFGYGLECRGEMFRRCLDGPEPHRAQTRCPAPICTPVITFPS
jgi:hypothetical protein